MLDDDDNNINNDNNEINNDINEINTNVNNNNINNANVNENSIDEDDYDESYSMRDDGFVTRLDENGEEKENYEKRPRFKVYRNNFVEGEKSQLSIDGVEYIYNDADYYNSGEKITDLINHCYQRTQKNMGIDDVGKDISLNKYKKALLKSMMSTEYSHSYFKDFTYNPFDPMTYEKIGHNIKIATDSDLRESRMAREAIAKENAKKDQFEIIQNQEKVYQRKHENTMHDFREFSSITDALKTFRKMEAFVFNKLVGGGYARFANKNVLNSVDFHSPSVDGDEIFFGTLNFDEEKVKQYKNCISDEEIIEGFLDNITKEERTSMFNSIRQSMNFVNTRDSVKEYDDELLSDDEVETLRDCAKTLNVINKYNKNRFFLSRWFSSGSSEEKALLSDLKAQFKIAGFSDEMIEKLKNGDQKAFEDFEKDLKIRNDAYVSKFGYKSNRDASIALEEEKSKVEIKTEKELEKEIMPEKFEEKEEIEKIEVKEAVENKEVPDKEKEPVKENNNVKKMVP